jgi:SPP1 family predicted phage head-tail adaptor
MPISDSTAQVAPIGQLRERVTLQALSVAVDPYGDPAYTWGDLATLWARVEPVGGRTSTLGERRTAVKEYAVTIRWRAGISPAQRFVWRGRYLQIEEISNRDERHRRITVQCRDIGVDAGAT